MHRTNIDLHLHSPHSPRWITSVSKRTSPSQKNTKKKTEKTKWRMNSFTNDLRATLPENSIITTPKETIIPEDLCAIILSRLPIKSIISFKLVCKNWNHSSNLRSFATYTFLISKSHILLHGRSCVEVARQKLCLITDLAVGILHVLSVLSSHLS